MRNYQVVTLVASAAIRAIGDGPSSTVAAVYVRAGSRADAVASMAKRGVFVRASEFGRTSVSVIGEVLAAEGLLYDGDVLIKSVSSGVVCRVVWHGQNERTGYEHLGQMVWRAGGWKWLPVRDPA